MTFDSVYEMTNDLKDIRKQHFWSYFSGSKLQESGTSSSLVYSNTSSLGTVSGGGNGTWISKISPVSMGTTLTGSYKVRFKMVFNSWTPDGGGSQPYECEGRTWFSNGNLWNGNPDGLGCRTETVQWQGYGLRFNARDSSGSSSTLITNSPSGTYYIECENPNDGTCTLKMFTDATYTTQTGSTYTHNRNPQNLNYFVSEHHNNYSGHNLGGLSFTPSSLYAYSNVPSTLWNKTETGASIEMNDEADGGLKLYTTSTGTNSNFTMDFDNKRPFSHTGSVCVFTLNADVQQASTTNWFLQVGLGHTVGNTGHWLSAKSAQSYLRLQTSQSESATYSADTTVLNSPDWVTAKIENKSSSCDLLLNGTVAVTNSSGLQTSTGMQPNVYGNRGTSGSAGSNPLVCKLRYFEAYNT